MLLPDCHKPVTKIFMQFPQAPQSINLPNKVMEAQVARCPFLSNLARVQGIEYAVSVGVCPTAAAPQPRRPILEEQYSFGLNFQAYHNPETGVVPLFGRPQSMFEHAGGISTTPSSATSANLCPWMKQQRAIQPEITVMTVPTPAASPLRSLPLATLSLGFAGSMVRQSTCIFMYIHRPSGVQPVSQV